MKKLTLLIPLLLLGCNDNTGQAPRPSAFIGPQQAVVNAFPGGDVASIGNYVYIVRDTNGAIWSVDANLCYGNDYHVRYATKILNEQK